MSDDPIESPFTPAHEAAFAQIREICERFFDASVFFCETRSDAQSGKTAVEVHRGFHLGGKATGLGLYEIHKQMIINHATSGLDNKSIDDD